MRAPIAFALFAAFGGCTNQGSFDLVLTLPTEATLRPNGMTTVTVVLTQGNDPPVATTSVLDGGTFAAGDLAAANDVQIEVLLRDASNRIVGVGEAGESIDIIAGQKTEIEIPVRRPFVYASDGAMLFSFDPTLDQSDSGFQGRLQGVSAPRVVVSVGGDRLAVVGTTQLQVIATDTNKPMGSPITLPGMTNDAAAVPGSSKVAVAHDGGIAIVDLDSGTVKSTAVGKVDRITVGPSSDGTMFAHGLIGRVEPLLRPFGMCTGTSMIVTVAVDNPEVVVPRVLPQPTSDLAAAPESPQLFATLPCTGKVVRVQGGIEGEEISFMDFAPLERASILTVDASRVWAAGTKAAIALCSNGNSGTGTCTPASTTRCPQRFTNGSIAATMQGAQAIVQSIPLAGGMPITIALPTRRESIVDSDDPGGQHSQVLRALGTTPLDFVVLPGGQYIGIVTKSQYYVEELTGSGGTPIYLPCLDAETSDWLLLDVATSSVAQRVRTTCSLVVGPSDDIFPDWECDDAPAGEGPQFGGYTPISVGGLFGAR
ncbi:MAG: hypothetical protein WKG01_14380 [Kofleriaceae bacterium]